MEILRKLRWVLYPSVFIFVFLFASYCTFPTDVVRKFVDNAVMNAALAIGPKDRGLPNISMDKVSLWRASGVSVSGLKIMWPAGNKSLPLSLAIDSLKGRLGLFSAFSSTKKISVLGNFYGGQLESQFKIRKPGTLAAIDLSLIKLDLAKVDFIESTLGAPLKGLFDIIVDIEADSQLSKDGSGVIKLNLENGLFGPGNINLPTGGFVSSLAVPLVKLGKLTVEMNLDKGVLASKSLTLSGGDIEAEMKLTIGLGRSPQMSRVDGNGWFSLKKEFLAANETFKMLFDLIPELRAAQQGDGKVGFAVRGILARPQFKLERYTAETKNGLAKPPAP